MIKNKGFPLNIYQILYEACVCSITGYAAEIFGFRQYGSIEKLHSRAIRAFLGVPKTTPVAGLRSEINWLEPTSRTQLKLIRMYHRLLTMNDNFLTKKVFLWDLKVAETSKFSTWSDEVKSILDSSNLMELFTLNLFDLRYTIDCIRDIFFARDQENLREQCLIKPRLN